MIGILRRVRGREKGGSKGNSDKGRRADGWLLEDLWGVRLWTARPAWLGGGTGEGLACCRPRAGRGLKMERETASSNGSGILLSGFPCVGNVRYCGPSPPNYLQTTNELLANVLAIPIDSKVKQ
jgi:hypothetical protein